jgi:hypothetical protein
MLSSCAVLTANDTCAVQPLGEDRAGEEPRQPISYPVNPVDCVVPEEPFADSRVEVRQRIGCSVIPNRAGQPARKGKENGRSN